MYIGDMQYSFFVAYLIANIEIWKQQSVYFIFPS